MFGATEIIDLVQIRETGPISGFPPPSQGINIAAGTYRGACFRNLEK